MPARPDADIAFAIPCRIVLGAMKEAVVRAMVAACVAAIVVAALLSACDGPPADSEQTLKALSATRVVAVPPPDATVIGSAQDRGSTSSITGHDPGVEMIYATAHSVGDVVGYYERTYPQYRFLQEGAPVSQKELDSRDGWAYIAIHVAPGQPDLSYGLNVPIKLRPMPRTATTYVLVVATGHESTPASTS
jgi:hypothetical protein